MLFSCSFAMDSLDLSQLKSHFFRHNLISAEISHLVLFLWDFSKTSNDNFDRWSDLRYYNCQVRLHPLKWTGISTWLSYSYLVWVNINPKREASGYMGKQPTHPEQLPFYNTFEGRVWREQWTGRCVNYSHSGAGVLLFPGFYLVSSCFSNVQMLRQRFVHFRWTAWLYSFNKCVRD